MHMESPALSLIGRKKGKKKFSSSAAKQNALALAAEWEAKKIEWAEMSKPSKKPVVKTVVKAAPIEAAKIKSLNTWITGAVGSKPSPQYTGTKMLGIGTLHKSNAVPVFSQEEAIDISSMRR